ncbi:MAG TPA: DUF512 domain-containing protein [Bacillota bacterium]|nr:DUF512 domain-containing protein [Bacillota bacterium]
MSKCGGGKITEVSPKGIGSSLGLEPGDILLGMNHRPLLDVIDYLMLGSETHLILEVLKKTGAVVELELEKEAEDSLGLSFEAAVFDGIRSCSNHCLFCFVHQLPKGQRSTLYVMDDDYRLSFLDGNYITLTNLEGADWRRIEEYRLSPLYISVHATDPLIRGQLLGAKTFDEQVNIIPQLERLVAAGITLHTQAVICPGINDGEVLEQTIDSLAKLWPKVASLAIVPVGLTSHRRNLFPLQPFSLEAANRVLTRVKSFQRQFLESLGTRFVFAADEWYLLTGEKFPEDGEYEDYFQLDNGVGLIRWFLTEFRDTLDLKKRKLARLQGDVALITGQSPRRMWEEVREELHRAAPGFTIEVLPVENQFFGPTVTVTGLLGGADVVAAIQNHKGASGQVYVIPEIVLKQDEDFFLDGVSVNDLRKAIHPKQVEIVPTRAAGWLEWMIERFRK